MKPDDFLVSGALVQNYLKWMKEVGIHYLEPSREPMLDLNYFEFMTEITGDPDDTGTTEPGAEERS